MRVSPVCFLPLLLVAASLMGDDLLPAGQPIEQVIDHYVEARLRLEGVAAAPVIDDANFLRRLSLDLAGRIPLAVEVPAFIESTDPQKRTVLVDHLLASPDFAFHQRNELNVLLMPKQDDGGWREWLLKVCQENRPWSTLFRQLMLARDDDPHDNKPAVEFIKSRARDLDDLTNDTSSLFFGVSINCAKCHDHPLVDDWTQDHYFGMASFFNRTYLTKKRFLGERDSGGVRFKTTEGVDKDAKLMFLTGVVLEEPGFPELSEDERKEHQKREKEDNDRETPPPGPIYSRRAQLVEIALRPDRNGYFPKAIVNRLWARFLGRGLVHPVDQMHSANPASHPELLAWLARDMQSHGYDLKRLIRGIVLSRTYARSSRWDQGDRPAAKLFAVAPVRALTPMQYSLSLMIAAENPEQATQRVTNPEQWASHRKNLESAAHGFSRQLESPGDNFQVGVSEALLFSNGNQIQNEYLRDSGDRLVGLLKGLSDRSQAIQTAIRVVFSRPAESEEIQELTRYLSAREERPVAGWQQVVWSMLTSGEFRFNY
jgi:hypothetical protein